MALRQGSQASFAAGELTPSLYGRVDIPRYQGGARRILNAFVMPQGGIANEAGTEFRGRLKFQNRKVSFIPFVLNVLETYVLEVGHQYIRFWKGGVLVMNGGSPYEVSTSYTEEQLPYIRFAQERDTVFLWHSSHPEQQLARFADTNWTLTSTSFSPSTPAPTGLSQTNDLGIGTETFIYAVTAVREGEESLASSPSPAITAKDFTVDGQKVTLSWSGVSGANYYNVYRDKNGIYALIGRAGSTTFVDDNIAPDTARTPPKNYTPFAGSGNYPIAGSFHENRLARGGTILAPEAYWFSQTNNYNNLTSSDPSKANDGFNARLTGDRLDIIQHLVSLNDLLILTIGSPWRVYEGSADYFGFDTIKQKRQDIAGCSHIRPLIVGGSVLFTDLNQQTIYGMDFDALKERYVPNPISVYADHLFRNRKVVDAAYARAPYNAVRYVMDDGQVVGLTLVVTQDLLAWHQHVYNQAVPTWIEAIVSVPENGQDVFYYAVRRTINGETVRYMERQHTRIVKKTEEAFFVHCGITYDGSPTTVISGLEHLENTPVVALAGREVIRGKVVKNGQIQLNFAAAPVHVGLGYISEIETLDINYLHGNLKSVVEVLARFEDSLGMTAAAAKTPTESVNIGEPQNYYTDDPLKLYTGQHWFNLKRTWDDHGRVIIRQENPLPMTLLSLDVKVSA